MRVITLYTDEVLPDLIVDKYNFETVDSNGDGPVDYHQYKTAQPVKSTSTLERILERDVPALNYTIVIDKRDIPTNKYILVELPDNAPDGAQEEFTNQVIMAAETFFPGDIEVGDVEALPNSEPENILSIVI